jgi:hypothetical protein
MNLLLDLSRRYPLPTPYCNTYQKLKYANLGVPDVRQFAFEDPRGFPAASSGCPDSLPSY